MMNGEQKQIELIGQNGVRSRITERKMNDHEHGKGSEGEDYKYVEP